jgi:leader peptidase (prepilin peptidase)/N-methyltransferase
MILAVGPVLAGGLVGAVIGSYATTAALRASAVDAPDASRSQCDGCRKRLGWFETAPVVSYVALRGRCRVCGDRISPFHPVGETVGLMTGAVLAWLTPDLRLIPLAIIAAALLAAAVLDARSRQLPDLAALAVALCGGALAFAGGRLVPGVIAAVVSGLVLLAARALSRTRDGAPGLGMGDVFLICALALWLGAATPWMVTGAAGLGLLAVLVRGRRDGKIAFGPMIALAGMTVGLLVEAKLWPGLS